MFPAILIGKLWHSTSVNRFRKIIELGAIVPEPNIPETERWGTSQGEKHYPFARVLGGVSLFDFNGFEPEAYSKKYPASSWFSFVPGQAKWTDTIWIEIDRTEVKENLITGVDLLKKWHEEKMYGHPIMPIIACAYIGELPTNNFKNVMLYDGDSKKYTRINIT